MELRSLWCQTFSIFMARTTTIILIGCFLLAADSNLLYSQSESPRVDRRVPWKTGGRFREALNKKIKFTAAGDLSSNLQSLSRSSLVFIWLDREVDPSQSVVFPDELLPLGQIVEGLSESIGASSLLVGSVVSIASAKKNLRLQVLRKIEAHRVSGLAKEVSAKWSEASELQWPFLSNPKDTLVVIGSSLGYQFQSIELIEHDLWAARNLPRMPKWEQMVFLLNSLNCYFLVDEEKKEIKIFPLREEQLFTVPYPKSQQSRLASKIRSSKLTEVAIVVQGNFVLVRATMKDQLIIAEQMKSQTKYRNKSLKPGSKDVFDLNYRGQRGAVLASIAKNRGVDLQYEPTLATKLMEPVTVNVKRVPIEELIKAVLKGTSLKFRLTTMKLEIFR
jgi:hypothetical protein